MGRGIDFLSLTFETRFGSPSKEKNNEQCPALLLCRDHSSRLIYGATKLFSLPLQCCVNSCSVTRAEVCLGHMGLRWSLDKLVFLTVPRMVELSWDRRVQKKGAAGVAAERWCWWGVLGIDLGWTGSPEQCKIIAKGNTRWVQAWSIHQFSHGNSSRHAQLCPCLREETKETS